ncbi:ABC transporter A, ABCA [Kipferlia bialata]|uniref:ABC transporter A, ABCA n=1 Tax=Kipferlia bialata TaxID=797122 RepID=A0A9K3CU00_9EUKA|nr:ABC transporter A, ABCA [Kipferlia bialata]|eukprot:g3512.t1
MAVGMGSAFVLARWVRHDWLQGHGAKVTLGGVRDIQLQTTWDVSRFFVMGVGAGYYSVDVIAPESFDTTSFMVLVVALQFLVCLNDVVSEKEGGRLQALRWVFQYLIYIVTLVPFMGCLYLLPGGTNIFPWVDASVMWIVFLSAGAAATSLGLFMASLFMHNKIAIMMGVILVAGAFVYTIISLTVNPNQLYDETFLSTAKAFALRLLFPFVNFVLCFNNIFQVAKPSTGVDEVTYESILIAPDYDFSFGMLFSDPDGAYIGDDMSCMDTSIADCTYENGPLIWPILQMGVTNLIYLVASWVMSEYLTTAGSVGRTPIQLLRPSYWSTKINKGSVRKHRRKSLTHQDADVKRETTSVLRRDQQPGARMVIHHLEKTFRGKNGQLHRAVRGVSMRMRSGQIYCLLGHNGAGKSTTINCITGVTQSDPAKSTKLGQAWLCKDQLSMRHHMGHIRRLLGVCNQHNTSIWPGMTPRQHLTMVCRMHSVPRFEVPRLIEDGLRSVALCLDPESRRIAWSAIKKAARQKRKVPVMLEGGVVKRKYISPPCILLTTHDMAETEYLADQICIMANGVTAAFGTTLRIKQK